MFNVSGIRPTLHTYLLQISFRGTVFFPLSNHLHLHTYLLQKAAMIFIIPISTLIGYLDNVSVNVGYEM